MKSRVRVSAIKVASVEVLDTVKTNGYSKLLTKAVNLVNGVSVRQGLVTELRVNPAIAKLNLLFAN